MTDKDNIGVVADNPYSVDKEFNYILKNSLANKKYLVVLSDIEKLRLGKSERLVRSTQPYLTAQLNDLQKRLLDLEMQDGGIKIQTPKRNKAKPVTWLHIIDKG